MKILLIGATHGNELLGPKLFAYILNKRHDLLEYVDFLIANPKALSKKVRYIDCDLNRSYGASGTKYEHTRAKTISKLIANSKYDLVIDLHTTNCEQPNIHIVHNTNDPNVSRFLRASRISKILQVTPMHDIGTVTSKMVAYEVPNRNLGESLYRGICDDIESYVRNVAHTGNAYLYKMTDKIYKKDVTLKQLKQFVNFQMCELGFVPVMTGNNSYKKQTSYYGFKANKGELIKL